MPTGYTYAVANGTETTLRQFALRAARGMGALIMMRDEPMDAPIPDRFEPHTYHLEALEQARTRMAFLRAMSTDEITKASIAWNNDNTASMQKAVQENDEQRDRYNRLIAEVEAWEGSPEGLKRFMLEQLRESLKFDVNDEPTRYFPKPRSPEEWWGEECREAGKNITYHANEYEKEVERTEERNKWVAQLLDALPPE